jgi:IS30 family transposase
VHLGLRGRKRRLELETEYWRLLASGVGTVAACQELGIGRKTGYRWRAENGGLPPVRLAEAARTGRFLSLLDRQRIATLRGRGLGVREIARRIGRAPSTVSRELRRNLRPHDQDRYDADLAHARARQRARRVRRTRLSIDPALRGVIAELLEQDWSPEQIAAHLRRAHPERPSWHVCHETIYQALYHGGKGGLSRTLTRRLRTGRALRRRRRRADQRQVRFIAPGRLIDQRPPEVETRLRIGDWEGDLIVGRLGRSAIGTLVERRTRYLRLVHLPDGHNAEQHRAAMARLLAKLPPAARLTLTWDQGTEIAYHDRLAEYFAEGIYFARPASPWMRGTNENTNGLLRQYFPKGTDLRSHAPTELAHAERRLNHRPRKILGWRTPFEIFHAALPHSLRSALR